MPHLFLRGSVQVQYGVHVQLLIYTFLHIPPLSPSLSLSLYMNATGSLHG